MHEFDDSTKEKLECKTASVRFNLTFMEAMREVLDFDQMVQGEFFAWSCYFKVCDDTVQIWEYFDEPEPHSVLCGELGITRDIFNQKYRIIKSADRKGLYYERELNNPIS